MLGTETFSGPVHASLRGRRQYRFVSDFSANALGGRMTILPGWIIHVAVLATLIALAAVILLGWI
jgi:hypothetical protein